MTPVIDGPHALSALSAQLADAVEAVSPAVVQVDGRSRRPSSGIVWAPELVLAAEHALEREHDLTVETASGPPLPAQLLGRDSASDLAVMRVPGLGIEPAPPAAAPARVGQFVLAVGRPGGRALMASLGIVSAVGGPVRTRGGLLDQYIRTDATPYPGFSGGPLIDARGAVLGLLTTGLAGGIALAVPAGLAWRLGETLARQGHVPRGWLGIGSQPVQLPVSQRAGRGHEVGLLIVDVARESPAERGGVLVGDILVTVDGQAIRDPEDLQARLSGDWIGRTVLIELLRGGTLVTLRIAIGQRPGLPR
ncbi:MAG TPA: trypsin-like peptidase domain-containing protein [Methylomirabilota bacterium]|nr:trypsin-like peptidase domain-containing protein [Methylomirabilota bacterium]